MNLYIVFLVVIYVMWRIFGKKIFPKITSKQGLLIQMIFILIFILYFLLDNDYLS